MTDISNEHLSCFAKCNNERNTYFPSRVIIRGSFVVVQDAVGVSYTWILRKEEIYSYSKHRDGKFEKLEYLMCEILLPPAFNWIEQRDL